MSTPQRRLVRLGLLAVFAVSHLATAANSAEHWLTRQRIAEAATGFHVLTTTVRISP